ncbi:AMP-binding protein [Rhodococcus sp. CX]|uniref:AMP-binding protein n=1 Tax=Rhodococcus sp. CX TaxID=2789880 RepID=UPI0018CF91D0|nr:AMP-binding protein [Rhodococcus sp. CX]MBH0119120.1 AMP-binding protein [Rhodococcus sp. CX]
MTTTDTTSLTGLLAELIATDPDAPLAFDVVGDEIRTCTRARFGEQVDALRTELADAGIESGQCIAAMLPNWSDALVWQFAASSLGAHVIGVNTRYNTGEVAHILVAARPAVVAVAASFHGLDLFGTLSAAAESASEVATPAVAVVTGPSAPATPVDPAGFDLGGGAWLVGSGDIRGTRVPRTPVTATVTAAGAVADPSDLLAAAFTTSGSTGTPKLAAHRDSAVVRHGRADAAIMGVVPGDVTLCVLPVSGVFGFSTAMATLAGGGSLLMEPVFDAAAVLRRMQELKVTHVVGGDDLFGRLYDTWHTEQRSDLSALKWLGIADFLGRSHDVARWARDEFGALTSGVFGSSEVFALTLLWSAEDPESVRWNGGGRPVAPWIEARIVDPVDDRVLPAGEQGELQLRGPNVVDAYLGNPEAAQRAFTADGWFRSGDLAVATGDGAYRFVCRMGDVLRLRGFLVDPAEIEHRLAQHPDVGIVKVVGITGDGGYTQAVAFVVPTDDASTDTDADVLKRWCREELAAFKVPSAVHIVDHLPTTVGGNGTKIRAVELREWAQNWTDRERDYRRD